jgi:hypothetical protein
MKITKDIAEIIRKKFIEQVELTATEAEKWSAYLTSINRAINRKAYADATPEQRIALRQQTNDFFDVACKAAIAAALRDRAFLTGLFELLIKAGATELIAMAEEI